MATHRMPTGSFAGQWQKGVLLIVVKREIAVLFSASVACLTALPSAAHHSVAINFEQGEPIEIRGTVKEVHMRNPHSQYVVGVPAGVRTTW